MSTLAPSIANSKPSRHELYYGWVNVALAAYFTHSDPGGAATATAGQKTPQLHLRIHLTGPSSNYSI
jgi:hypothetical protein